MKKVVLCFVLMLISAQMAIAHDVWIGKRDGGLVVLRGHGDKLEAYDPANVKEPLALDAKGSPVGVEIVKNKEDASLSPKAAPAVVAAVYEGGYWLKTTDGWKKTTRTEAKGKFDIVEALKSKTCCKAYQAPSEAFSKPVGQFFEIIPQKDPTALHPGDTLAVKVLLDGKPVEGAVISSGGGHDSDKKDPLKTDKDGSASVVIQGSGQMMIKANHKIPVQGDPDADVLYLASTITF